MQLVLFYTAEGLKAISRYLATLEFADSPDYDRLRADLTSIPDAYPALKYPQANGQVSHTSSYAPTHAASPTKAAPGPIPAISYLLAHPSSGTAPIQYPEAAWGSAQAPHQYSYEAEGMLSEAAWQGYGPNGFARDSPYKYGGDGSNQYSGDTGKSHLPAAVQHQHHWYSTVHVSSSPTPGHRQALFCAL